MGFNVTRTRTRSSIICFLKCFAFFFLFIYMYKLVFKILRSTNYILSHARRCYNVILNVHWLIRFYSFFGCFCWFFCSLHSNIYILLGTVILSPPALWSRLSRSIFYEHADRHRVTDTPTIIFDTRTHRMIERDEKQIEILCAPKKCFFDSFEAGYLLI